MDNQDYVDIAYENLEGILHLYNEHKDKHPVMLFDVQERRVYAYPYAGFKADLSKQSQGLLSRQYKKAMVAGEVVVFVRDNKKRKLVSFNMDLDKLKFEPPY